MTTDLFDALYPRAVDAPRKISVHDLGAYLCDYALGGTTERALLRSIGLKRRAALQLRTLLKNAKAATDPVAYSVEVEMVARIEEGRRTPRRKTFMRRLKL